MCLGKQFYNCFHVTKVGNEIYVLPNFMVRSYVNRIGNYQGKLKEI